MNKIDTVMFDVGGVLHKGYQAVTQDLASALGVSKDVLANIWTEEIPLLGAGKMNEREFWSLVGKKYRLKVGDVDKDMLGRVFKQQLVPNVEVGRIVKRLGELNIKRAVLSNTIEPHAKVLREAGLYDGFDVVLLSHEIGLRKPSIEIYRYALDALKAKPETTVLIDDDVKNVEAALQVGIRGVIFVSPDQLRNDLKRLIPDL